MIKNNKGYSLIEVMISLVIFTIGIMGFSSFSVAIRRATALSSTKVYALNLTQQQIEKLKQIGYRKLSTGKFSERLNLPSITNGTRDWEIIIDSPLPRTASVKVMTQWKSFGNEHKVELSTVIGE